MKKRLLLLILILATAVFAAENLESNFSKTIPRYDDFPLDNIHILRLQEASTSLGGNVSDLKRELAVFQEQRSKEIADLQTTITQFEQTVISQIAAIQISLDRVSSRVDDASEKISGAQVAAVPEPQGPVEIKFPPYLMILLAVNLVLLIVIIALIFWIRTHLHAHKEEPKDIPKEEHIHPAPPELIAYVKAQFDRNKKLHDIRMELAGKGWTPSIIEHAVHAAREK